MQHFLLLKNFYDYRTIFLLQRSIPLKSYQILIGHISIKTKNNFFIQRGVNVFNYFLLS